MPSSATASASTTQLEGQLQPYAAKPEAADAGPPQLAHEWRRLATLADVIQILAPLVVLYRDDRDEAAWELIWPMYGEALAGLTPAAIHAGARAFVADPYSRRFPLPGPLRAFAEKAQGDGPSPAWQQTAWLSGYIAEPDFWPRDRGPRPGDPGCRIFPDLLAHHGFEPRNSVYFPALRPAARDRIAPLTSVLSPNRLAKPAE